MCQGIILLHVLASDDFVVNVCLVYMCQGIILLHVLASDECLVYMCRGDIVLDDRSLESLQL
jgi:hypothetical protein